jgi:hypothetical protein
MVWIVVLGLAAWTLVLTLQLADVRARASYLERRILDLKEALERLAKGDVRRAADAEAPIAAKPAREPAREAPDLGRPVDAPAAAARTTLTDRIVSGHALARRANRRPQSRLRRARPRVRRRASGCAPGWRRTASPGRGARRWRSAACSWWSMPPSAVSSRRRCGSARPSWPAP